MPVVGPFQLFLSFLILSHHHFMDNEYFRNRMLENWKNLGFFKLESKRQFNISAFISSCRRLMLMFSIEQSGRSNVIAARDFIFAQ